MTVVDTSDLREQVAQQQSPQAGQTVKQAVRDMLPSIARALPKATGMTADRFARLVTTEIARTPKLQECTVGSFVGAMMYAAQLGVEPGPLGHAYLVPFGNSVTFILGYKGMIELARRSGEIKSIEARAVYANDEFEWSYGLEDVLVHKPALDDRGEPVRYYGIARFKDGGHYFLVLSKAEVERRRNRSKAKNSGPWTSDYEAMALKTVVRAMQPYLPLTSEVATAIELDERVNATFDPDAPVPLQIAEAPYEDEPQDVPEAGQPSLAEGAPEDAGPGVGSTAPDAGPASSDPPIDVEPSLPVVVDTYDGETVGALRKMLVARTLPDDGTKPELIERLRADDQRPM